MITSKSGPSLATYAAGKIVADELPSTSGTATAVSASNGTVAAPSIAFANSTGSGLYRIGADDIGLAIAGTKTVEYKAAGVSYLNGTAAAPTVSAIAENTTGIYFATGVFGITAAGTQVANFSSAGILNNVAGAAGTPSYSYVGNTNTGEYMTGTTTTSALNYACNGVLQGSWTTAGVLVKAGSAAAPSICIGSTTTTGFWQDTTNVGTGWSSAGVQKIAFGSTAAVINAGRASYEFVVLDNAAANALRVVPAGGIQMGTVAINTAVDQCLVSAVSAANVNVMTFNQGNATKQILNFVGTTGTVGTNSISTSTTAGTMVGAVKVGCPAGINSGQAWITLRAVPS